MTSPSTESACASTSSALTAYIGNLRSDCVMKQLENEIQNLFQTVGVVVADGDVKAHRKSAKKPAFAFVNLEEKSKFDLVVEKLNGLPAASRKELIFPGTNLEISLARKNLSKSEAKITPAKIKKTRRHSKKLKHKASNGKLDVENNQPETGWVVMGKGSGSMATSSVTIATSTTTLATSNAAMGTNVLSGSDLVTLDPKKRSYFLGQKLRTEDRLTEYKQGGGNYLDAHFKIHLAKYVCAFLNSEGGTLIVGVQDDCTVCGVKISTKKEDLLRLEIDHIMKGFNPPVFTNSYSVTFVPVYKSTIILTNKPGNHSANLLDDNSTSSMLITNSKDCRSADSADIVDHRSSMPTTDSENYSANSISCVMPITNYYGNHNSDVVSSPKSSLSSENSKENDKDSHSHAPKRLPPLKTFSSQAVQPSSAFLLKPDCDNNETSNEVSCGEASNLHGNGMISEGVKAIKTDLKVIEVKVHHICGEDSGTLYETNKGEVYLRRDGSIQGPLKASQILAWSKQNINKNHHLERTHLRQEIVRKQEEVEMNMKLVDELVKQKQFLEEEYQEKIEKLKENEGKLHAEISLLKSQEAQIQGGDNIRRNRSKVCVIV